jgi:hypothetical protein
MQPEPIVIPYETPMHLPHSAVLSEQRHDYETDFSRVHSLVELHSVQLQQLMLELLGWIRVLPSQQSVIGIRRRIKMHVIDETKFEQKTL